jgi:hypothetical protein
MIEIIILKLFYLIDKIDEYPLMYYLINLQINDGGFIFQVLILYDLKYNINKKLNH